jgi:fructose-1,6-bisphosphatase/inositol monophosphatase family enzyme
MSVDLADVAALLRDVAAAAILPRRNRLLAGRLLSYVAGELVTVADREAESLISAGLSRLLPGVPVVGEEAVAEGRARTELLDEHERVWLVDPRR